MSNNRVSFGYLVPTREAVMSGDFDAQRLLRLADRAEQLGYDSVWVGDSIVARARHEPLAMLAAIAARTQWVELGTAVLLPVLRHPVVLAHHAATVDQISEGRLILGVGIATDTPTTHHEFESVGVPFARRVGRFNEHLDICRRLWAGEKVSHHSDFYDLDEVQALPTPHREGGPPLWVAGSNEVTQRRAGRMYDGWMPIGHADQFASGLSVVQNAATESGRDLASIATASYLTVALNDDADAADKTLNDYLAAYYPAPPAAMRAVQATYAGSASGLAEWVNEFVAAGSQHIIIRCAGDHDEQIEQVIDCLRTLR